MPEFKTLKLAEIHVPEDRLRKVDENKAYLFGQSVVSGGLINPVTVYRTPNGKKRYTLAAGATRHRGHELHGLAEIECLIRKLDKAGARRIEIEENLFRDELTKLERAEHVVEYRRLFEDEHGKIARGNPKLSNSAKLAELEVDSAQAHFFAQALDELGLSRRAIERAQFIGSKLTKELRNAIRGSKDADNQQMLEKLAGMEPERQKKVAKALAGNGDIKLALDATDPHAKSKADQSAQQRIFSRLVDSWERAEEKTKADFLAAIGAKMPSPRDRPPSASEMIDASDGSEA